MRSAFALLLTLAACTRGTQGLTVQQVRASAAGTPVTVEGIVSVPSGVIDAGFAITDGEAGIHVAADSTRRYAVGDRVRVTGRRGEAHGMATVQPDAVERIGKATLPPPKTVRTGEVGEATEGWRVRVSGRAVTPVVSDLPYGYKLWIDDGSGRLQLFFAPTDLRKVRVGQTVTAIGFSGQYDTVYEVLPTSPADLQIAP
jgi:hypothetical protein